MTYLRKQAVYADDTASIDAFGRWRVSSPQTIFDSKQIFDKQPLFWDDQETTGSGTSSTYNTNQASTTIAVSGATAGTRVRQTFQRFNYQPGKSQQVFITAVVADSSVSGITRRVGQFDDNNGIFFELDGSGDIYAVIRTNTSGSPVDNSVVSSSWNIDPFNGTGPSGVTLDPTKAQIIIIDYEWLGVGRVRMGFVVDGIIYYGHEFLNANNLSLVYMSTPNLPLRFEINNDGSGDAADMTCICASVKSEGGQDEIGALFSDSLGNSFVNANTVGTYYALLGIRLKSAYIGINISLVTKTLLAVTNDNFLWQLRFNPTVAGTFTYNDVPNSAVQIAKGDTAGNPSATTVTLGQVVASGYSLGNSAETISVPSARKLGAAIDGTVDEIVLCVNPLASNLDVYGSFTWREQS